MQEPYPISGLENLCVFAVQNGWVVRLDAPLHQYTPANKTFVFRTVEELAEWMVRTLPRHAPPIEVVTEKAEA